MRLLTYLGLSLLLASPMVAYGKQCPPKTCPSEYNKIAPTIELKNGYFFFSDHTLRKIYDKGGWDVQLCGSYPIYRWLQISGGVEYFRKTGKSTGGQNTSIREVTLSVGLKPVVTIVPDKIQYYFTIGPRYFFVHQHNDSSFVDRNVNNNGIGGYLNTGFNFIVMKHFLIDLFGEYSYCRMHFHAHKHNVQGKTTQIGGFTFGVGLGYSF